MTHRRVVLVLGLATMISMASPKQGQHFPKLRTYSENEVETVTCPRNCSRDGDGVAFCIFDNATSVPRHLYSYLYDNNLLVGNPGSDCDGRTSGNGIAFISFIVKPWMSGSTIYCVQRLLHCSSLVNTLIPPLLINVEAENRCNNSPTLSPIPSPTPISSATSPLTLTPPATPPTPPTSPTSPTSTPLTSTPTAPPTTSPTASAPPTTPSTPPAAPTTSAPPPTSPTSTPTPTATPTSAPPTTPTTSAENLSSPLQTPSSFPSTPTLALAMTDKSLVGGIAVGVFIAGLLLGVTCGIAITIIVTRIATCKGNKSAATASSQELDTSGSSLGD